MLVPATHNNTVQVECYDIMLHQLPIGVHMNVCLYYCTQVMVHGPRVNNLYLPPRGMQTHTQLMCPLVQPMSPVQVWVPL